jgi:hypothetical protein
MFSTKGISFAHMRLWVTRLMGQTDFVHVDDYHFVEDVVNIEYPVSRDKLSTSWNCTNIKVVMRSTEGYVMMKLTYG